MSTGHRHGRTMGISLAMLAVVVGLAFLAGRQPDPVRTGAIPGMVRQTEIRIAPEITGRLAALMVAPGDHVRSGDLLASIDNPELSAALEEARAALASARAERGRIYAGVRAEEVAIAAQAVETAEANLGLARSVQKRIATLAGQGHASREQLDQSNAGLAKAEADLALKQARHAAAIAGPTAEERALADARVALAEAAAASLEAQLQKTRLTAPADGVIGITVAEPGEIMVPGRPVLTLNTGGVDGGTAAGRWFSFTLREDTLRALAVGSDVTLTMADGSRLQARISELRPLGEFATWRAARAVGDHDLNSFRLRAEPLGSAAALEPGMTVWLSTGK